ALEHGLAVLVLQVQRARHAPPERLAVDVDRLHAAVVVLDAARHALGERGREARGEQVVGFDEVGVARVGPDLVHDGCSWVARVAQRPRGTGRKRGVDMPVPKCSHTTSTRSPIAIASGSHSTMLTTMRAPAPCVPSSSTTPET